MSEGVNFDDSQIFVDLNNNSKVNQQERLEQVRSAVEITRDAVKAVSITAIDLLKEIPSFMAGLDLEAELKNPFSHIEAPIWEEEIVPQEMIDAAYAYCELLTKKEAGNFYHSYKLSFNHNNDPHINNTLNIIRIICRRGFRKRC